MSIFEAGMLICFGAAWPTNILKTVRSKSTKGKSLLFLVIVIMGYICGIIHKILYSRDIVLALYIINICMVLTDLTLSLYYKRKESTEEKSLVK
ncbi:MAG: hypothetical protein N2Z65_06545 [Clostridiales bacterium]|nr:hypothetical protein [Clostridiales bacterium]